MENTLVEGRDGIITKVFMTFHIFSEGVLFQCYLLKLFTCPVANVLGFFWTMFFISGVSDMMLASTFSTWYWTYNKRDLPFFTLTSGIYRTLRYESLYISKPYRIKTNANLSLFLRFLCEFI